jgi:redox-sensitive bicupin YhaK (pirin superfamily)
VSWHACPLAESRPAAPDEAAVELELVPRTRDLGGFEVGRVLPSGKRRAVGPFVFFDQMGPSIFGAGRGLDVRPHPHIGLATLTYLFEGEILHRDSVGSMQAIRPGAVNWMTAGRGIVHSERTAPELRAGPAPLFGIQAWIALPRAAEETAPAFHHHAAASLPTLAEGGINLRLIAGELMGLRSPVTTFSETLYADISLAAGARLPLDHATAERALYLVSGEVDIDGHRHAPGRMLLLRRGAGLELRAGTDARLLLVGGEPLDGPRYLWWNFVSSSKQRIEAAKTDWQAGRFPDVPGDAEFIPLPDTPGP